MSNTREQYLVTFHGYSKRESVCHLFVDNAGVVLGELEDNKGSSVTNALEIVCAGVAAKFFGRRLDFAVFEWVPGHVLNARGRMFKIKWHADGLRMPEWVSASNPPAYVRRAEREIGQHTAYTAKQLRRAGIQELDLNGAREVLEELRHGLPPVARRPDRAPKQ